MVVELDWRVPLVRLMVELRDSELQTMAERYSEALCLQPFDGVYCIRDKGHPNGCEFTGSFMFDAVAVLKKAYELRQEREKRGA